jgi:uncharacterized protein (DUF342 family)
MALDPNYKDWPLERLCFEYEKRQREIPNIQMEIQRLAQLEDSIAEACLSGHGDPAMGAEVNRQGFDLQMKVSRIRSEMSDIEQSMESKWSNG